MESKWGFFVYFVREGEDRFEGLFGGISDGSGGFRGDGNCIWRVNVRWWEIIC